ncbi:hypothetical protein Bca4012_056688 [Brassica carinata]
MTGRICLKSPPSKTVIPPKGFCEASLSERDKISRSVRSTASIAWRCAIGASSQTMRSAWLKKLARTVPVLTSHKVSSYSFKGILNLEWAVRPPGRRRAAIADEATGGTLFQSEYTAGVHVG